MSGENVSKESVCFWGIRHHLILRIWHHDVMNASYHWHSLIMTFLDLEAVTIEEIHGNGPHYPCG